MRTDIEGVKKRFGIIGDCPALDRAIEIAHQVAPTDLSVLISGESGVGKEFFPQIVHQYGSRKHGPYVAVNCGAIPAGTIDSELFGHVKGAFTGALDNRKGYFEMANGGTIFLDEVGELPPSTQAQLLRVLESGEYMRVGSSQTQRTDIRIVAATNVDLPHAIAQGHFREDLYYRLAAIPVLVPPLRERGNDTERLFLHFARDFGERYQMPSIHLDAGAVTALHGYHWPGNVRQLKNVTEQISILEKERLITAEVFHRYIPTQPVASVPAIYQHESADYRAEHGVLLNVLQAMQQEREAMKRMLDELLLHGDLSPAALGILARSGLSIPTQGAESASYTNPQAAMPGTVHQLPSPHGNVHTPSDIMIVDEPTTLEGMEEEAIRRTLNKHRQNRRETARELNISERTLYRKIKQYNIQK